LDFYGDSKIIDVKRKQIGTETVSAKDYQTISETGLKNLDNLIKKIANKDKKRAYIVKKFFGDMDMNLNAVKRLLKKDGHYIIVIGNSRIRDIEIPTNEILIDIAKLNGFKFVNMFSYVIKNRYLRIPRSGKGGLIKKDWIIDLVK